MSFYVKDDEWGTKYPHFQKSEFTCPCCGSVGDGIASSLLVDLEKLRDEYGAIQITSGYRCPNYNREVGGVSNSAHMRGQAADFYIMSGITNNQDNRIAIVNEIKGMPYYHYAYCNVNGDTPSMGNAIHMDTYLVDIEPEPQPEPQPMPEPIDDKDKQIEELNATIKELNDTITLKDKQIQELVGFIEKNKCQFNIEEDNYYKLKVYKNEILLIHFAKDTEFEMKLSKDDIVKIK